MAKGASVISGNFGKMFKDEKPAADKKGFGQFNEGLKYIKYKYYQ